jgi:hypothetical protein
VERLERERARSAERVEEREALAAAVAATPQVAVEDLGIGAGVQTDSALRFEFPGHGAAGPTCGQSIRYAHAPTGGGPAHWTQNASSCNKASCPLDFEKWAAHEAVEIARRVGDGLPRVGRKNAIHVVASPPQAWALTAMRGRRSFVKMRRRAQKLLRRVGVVGGCLIFHHKRVASRWNDRPFCADGPHFHAIGAGWIEGTAELAKKIGWVVVNLGVRKSVYATALYILSHAGLGYPASAKTEQARMAVNTVVWFGEWSYQKFPSVPGPDEEGRWCPICEAYVPVREWFKLEPGPPDENAPNFGEIPLAEFELARQADVENRCERVWG